jgi:type IV pilus assembly protein PilM
MPKDVLNEYEDIVTAAGYLPGAVLPSTLAALAGLDEAETPVLVVNAGPGAVTTAIVRGGVLLLHRSVDMAGESRVNEVAMTGLPLPLVDRESSAQEWAQQEAQMPGGYDRFDASTAMQTQVLEQAEIAAIAAAHEVVQAVSVAAAYFEDSLQVEPEEVLAAGAMGAEALAAMMQEGGLESLKVHELVDVGMLQAGTMTASVPRGWLAGVRGALKN